MVDIHRQSNVSDATKSYVRHNLDLSTPKGILLYSAPTAIIMIGFDLIHAFIHEMLGHGLFGILLGLQVKGFYISPLGISYTYISMNNVPTAIAVLEYSAGTIVSVLVGIILQFWLYPIVKRRSSSFGPRFLVLIFIIVLETDLLYAFVSPLVSFGDVFGIAQALSIYPSGILSLTVLPIIFLVYYYVLRDYFELLAPFIQRDQILNESQRRRFLLKVTYTPVMFVIIIELIGVAISYYSFIAGVAFFILLILMVSPMLPTIYIVSHLYNPAKQGIDNMQDPNKAIFSTIVLWKYALIFILLMSIDLAVFGLVPHAISSI